MSAQTQYNKIPAVEQVGKKAYFLYFMQSHDLPVPPFTVVNSEWVHQILAPLKTEVMSLFKRVEGDAIASLGPYLESFQFKIKSLQLNPTLASQIQEEALGLFGQNYRVSVRSSAVMEDGDNSSFAGQFSSYLNCKEDQLLEKVKSCIASFFSPGVMAYRKAHGLLSDEYDFAVVIQEMVQAKSSGVAFSVNQTQNMADALIVAGYGLGEGIVTDRVETDTYKVDRQTRSIAKNIKEKHAKLVSSPDGGLQEQKVNGEQVKKQVLTDAQILEVFDLCLNAEKLLEHPSDIEFSYDEKGALTILQMRPITTLKKEQLIILDNTNIVESYPGLTLPLSYSFALKAYEMVMVNCADAFWLSKNKRVELAPVFSELLYNFKGRIYYRLENWFTMIGVVYKSKQSIKAWENAVGLKDGHQNIKRESVFSVLKMVLVSIWMLINHPRRVKRFFKDFQKDYHILRDPKTLVLPSKDLWNHYELNMQHLFKQWDITVVNDFLAFKYFGVLQSLLNRYGVKDQETIANDLMTNHLAVDSELAVVQMLRLKQEVLAHSTLTLLFKQSPKEIWEALQASEYSVFLSKIHNYLDQYGDRTLAELKLETPSLRQNPLILIQLLQRGLTSTLKLSEYLQSKDQLKERAWKKIKTQVSNPFKILLLRFFVRLSSNGLKNRENMRFSRTRVYGAVKEIFSEIGARMQKEQLLEQSKDVFYLHTKDLAHFCLGEKDTNLKEKVRNEKEKYQAYKSIDLPDRVIYHKGEEPEFESATRFELSENRYKGEAVSKGKVKAEVVVITEPSYDIDVKGKILVTRMTDPGWVFLMAQSCGIISEKGSILSHTAIVGRELGIPVVVGLAKATTIFKTGQIVTLDGDKGIVHV